MKLLLLLFSFVTSCSQVASESEMGSVIAPDLRTTINLDITENQQIGECHISIFSNTETGHIKILARPDNCDPIDENNFSKLKEMAKKIAMRTGKKKEIYLSIPFPSSVIIERWAPIVAQSAMWKKRPKLKNVWDTSSYSIVTTLLNDNREVVYAPYSLLLNELGYMFDEVEMEKLAEFKPEELGCCQAVLKNQGFSAKNKLPYPLMILIKAKQKAND